MKTRRVYRQANEKLSGARQRVRRSELECFVYAPHGHDLMGWKSPVGEFTLTMLSMITTSRRQGQDREALSEGSRSAKPRADEQKRDTRLSNRVELAQDNEDVEFELHSKFRSCVVTGHVLIGGDLNCKRCTNTAHGTAMGRVSFQKSAAVVVVQATGVERA